MYKAVYNTDTLVVTKVKKNELRGFLEDLERQGATLCLDIDNDITYSFTDDFEGDSIEDIIEAVNS